MTKSIVHKCILLVALINLMSFTGYAQLILEVHVVSECTRFVKLFNASKDTVYYVSHSLTYRYVDGCASNAEYFDSSDDVSVINVSNTGDDYHWIIPDWYTLLPGRSVFNCFSVAGRVVRASYLTAYVRALPYVAGKKRPKNSKIMKTEGAYRQVRYQ
jgi:hypothetical protein